MQFVNEKNIEIDPELEKLLPPLSKEDYQMLEQSLLQNGFMQHSTRIQLWCPPEEEENDNATHPAKSYIIDGHNRFRICQKHNIDLPSWCFDWLCFDTKEEVKKYIYENQLARRNLSPIQKISIAEQYRAIYEKQAKENQSLGGGDKKSEDYQKSVGSNLTQAVDKKRNPTTDEKLSKIAGIKTTTYKMGAKVLKSDNEDLKQRVLSGETSISAGYKELMMNRNKNSSPKEKEPITPKQKIIEFDNRMNEIDKEISSLKSERETLIRRRSSLFESLDIPFTVKYRFSQRNGNPYGWECQFYIEFAEKEEILYEGNCYFDEKPADVYLKRIPEKYQKDFEMAWNMAHKEVVNENKKYDAKVKEENKKLNETLNDIQEFYNFVKLDKAEYYVRKFHKDLMKIYHPDNIKTGDNEAMQYLNKLKHLWGI